MRSLVLKCPRTSVDVIVNLTVRDRARLLAANAPFAFTCHCCDRRHFWRLRDSRYVRHREVA